MTITGQPAEPPSGGQSPVLIATAKEYTERHDLLDCTICRKQVSDALSSRGYSVLNLDIEQSDLLDPGHIIAQIGELYPLCVFNLFEGFHNTPLQEANFCEVLEENNIPFTGNPSRALRFCNDKFAIQQRLIDKGIPVPVTFSISRVEEVESLGNISFPVFLKPRREDGSVGIDEKSLVYNRQELDEAASAKLCSFPEGIIIQEFLTGPEYFVSLIGNGRLEPLTIYTLDYNLYPKSRKYLSYDAKWNEKSTDWNMWPEKIDHHPLVESIIKIASRAAEAAGCSGYLRVDLREKEGELFVIDINPNPALTRDSGIARQYMESGKTYEQLVEEILQLALLKHKKGQDHENY